MILTPCPYDPINGEQAVVVDANAPGSNYDLFARYAAVAYG